MTATDIAWQKQIRDHIAAEVPQTLFGRYWESLNLRLPDSEVREIDVPTAATIILKYEWLGCLPAVIWHCYGIYFDDVLGGVVVFGPEYAENLGVWDKYGFTGKIICLSRGACEHWTPKNTASFLIRQAMKLLPARFQVVTATIDPLAGEIGTIYQACGWRYLGVMRQAKTRTGIKIDGKMYGSRSLRSRFGHQRRDVILSSQSGAEFVEQMSKMRYMAFRGSVKQRKANTAAIAHLLKPYPKRAENAGL
jgi:hypothetical protein